MKNILFLLAMFFCHIVDDYYLQGWLASAKQKEWWKKNAPDKLYERDYLMALFEHAFSWSFMVHLAPIVSLLLGFAWFPMWLFLASFVFNWIIHALVDDLKANKHKINLIQDQIVHIFQVVIIWILLFNL